MTEEKRYKGIKDVGENIVSHDQLCDPGQVEERIQKRTTHFVRITYLLAILICFCKTHIHTILGQDRFKGNTFLSIYMLKEATP